MDTLRNGVERGTSRKVIDTYTLRRRELVTTDTEENAIARLAAQGGRLIPSGTNSPAASGIPIRLYTIAHRKLNLILLTVRRDSWIAPITSMRLF